MSVPSNTSHENLATTHQEEVREELILCEGLGKRYGELQAVQGLDLHLAKGDILALLGPNGAGKSTTLKLITGLLQASQGRIWIGGHDLQKHPMQARKLLGYLPEQVPIHPELTVDEYLQHAGRLHGLQGKALRAAVARARERCGLSPVRKRLCGLLSKGYQQRVGIAQAILHDPQIIVLDEPTVGLDPLQIQQIRDLILDLGRSAGVILSTHILPEVRQVCNRVQILRQGQTVFDDALAGLEERHGAPAIRVRFQRPPETQQLQAITGVEAVESLEEGEYLLHHAQLTEAAETLTETLCKAALEGDWGLRSLTPGHTSLEEIFVRLTHRDSASQDKGSQNDTPQEGEPS